MQEVVRKAERAIVYEVDREEGISQSDAEPVKKPYDQREKPVMTMNTPVQNADDVAELVFAMVLNSARNSFDGDSGMNTDDPSQDERVTAARDKFMNASDEEVSDEDGCLSRSMTIKAHRRIMRERIMISRVASEVSFQPLYSDIGAPLREERVITVRKKPNLNLEFYQRGVTDGVRTQIVSRDSQHVTLRVL